MLDWKLIGYCISGVSVILLGAAAAGNDASWKPAVLVGGMVTSLIGMACREYSHRREKSAIAFAQEQASKARPKESG